MYTYKVKTFYTLAGLKFEKDEEKNAEFEELLNSMDEKGWEFVSFAFVRNNGGEVSYKVVFRKQK